MSTGLRTMLMVAATASFACLPLPPPMMPIDGVAPEATGSTSVRAYGAAPFLSEGLLGAGGGLRVGQQLTQNLSVSIDTASFGGEQSVYIATRGSARWTMDNQKVAFVVGVGEETLLGNGVASSNGFGHSPVFAGTADASVRIGTFVGKKVELFAVGGINGEFGKDVGSGFAYIVFGAGIHVRLTSHLRLSADVEGETLQLSPSGGGGAVWCLPTLSLGYVFEGLTPGSP